MNQLSEEKETIEKGKVEVETKLKEMSSQVLSLEKEVLIVDFGCFIKQLCSCCVLCISFVLQTV